MRLLHHHFGFFHGQLSLFYRPCPKQCYECYTLVKGPLLTPWRPPVFGWGDIQNLLRCQMHHPAWRNTAIWTKLTQSYLRLALSASNFQPFYTFALILRSFKSLTSLKRKSVFLLPITLRAHYNSQGDSLIPGHPIFFSVSLPILWHFCHIFLFSVNLWIKWLVSLFSPLFTSFSFTDICIYTCTVCRYYIYI